MAYFGIAVRKCTDDVAVLKILRGFTSESISVLRSRLGTTEPVLILSEWEFPPELGMDEGLPHQHRLVLQVFSAIRAAGAEPELSYWVDESDPPEIVSEAVAKNLFRSTIDYLRHEHD